MSEAIDYGVMLSDGRRFLPRLVLPLGSIGPTYSGPRMRAPVLGATDVAYEIDAAGRASLATSVRRYSQNGIVIFNGATIELRFTERPWRQTILAPGLPPVMHAYPCAACEGAGTLDEEGVCPECGYDATAGCIVCGELEVHRSEIRCEQHTKEEMAWR